MSTNALNAVEARRAFKKVQADAEELALFPTDSRVEPKLPSVGQRKKRMRAGEPDPVSTVSLVLNDDGVLFWREAGPVAGELVELYQYEKLAPNEVNAFLTRLDGKLNPDSGLRVLRLVDSGGKLSVAYDVAKPVTGTKRRLLLVHGTFSRSLAFIEGIQRAKEGEAFLRRVFAHYEEVLAFEHPTLSVSPILNAFDLFVAMAGAQGPLDIVAHSRGGLVTRWFLEGFGGALKSDGPYRAVLVGSPLGGTSLASPQRLKDSLSMLSNLGTVLQTGGAAASAYVPLLMAPLALLKIATSVVNLAANTPVIDAAISMIPGLGAQSRVGMNHELDRCFAFALSRPPAYYVVTSNFETENPRWNFWKWFRGERVKDIVTNHIFDADNDLVVDTASMNELVRVKPGQKKPPRVESHDFGTNAAVHHTNYFEQPQTLAFILEKLQVA